jgi:hypothetical protein
MEILCNLYSQWIDTIRQEMTNAGFDHSALSDQDCAIKWQAWKRRLVPAGIRTIAKANRFNCPPNLQQGLVNIEQAFITGADIWPWQSKLIDRPSFEDGLYNDYRIVHFHLGIGFDLSGYINRTGTLLFAVVNSATVYEVGIYNHGDWFELDILDIIDANWPDLLDDVTIHSENVANCPATRDEVQALREANIQTIIRLNSGRIVAPPGGGTTMDGTSIEAVRSACYLTKLIHYGEKAIIEDIREQVHQGMMARKDYEVLLKATDNEIAGVVKGIPKWILWKRTKQS